jgi:hypothetical protein
LKQKIQDYNIDTSHFFTSKRKRIVLPLKDILKENTFINTCGLKQRLYKEGLKERKCELCGQDENWKTGKISLILDHIDGNKTNNTIENLRIVCPNCDATLPTYKGKNKKNKIKNNYYLKGFEHLKNNNKFINKNKIETRIKQINESNIDFSKYGWRLEVSDLLDIWPQRAGDFIKKHMPEIWNRAWKHKN